MTKALCYIGFAAVTALLISVAFFGTVLPESSEVFLLAVLWLSYLVDVLETIDGKEK